MDTAVLVLGVAIAGVNFGWQPAEDRAEGYEYVVQVEPELVEALDRGETIPIESYVPPEVAPICKVRIVVGREELPRTAVHHTANFAGQSGWTSDQSTGPATGGRYDRYPAAGAPPALESAGQQLSQAGTQAVNGVQNATQQFGQQLQQWSNSAGRQMQSVGADLRSATDQTLDAAGNQLRQGASALGLSGSSPPPGRGAGGVSAPPWPVAGTAPSASATAPAWTADASGLSITPVDTTASPGMTMTRTAGGWTSIGSNVAAPPLLNPPLATASGNDPSLRVAATNGAERSVIASPPTNREPIYTPLVDPGRQPAASNANAGNGWSNNSSSDPWTTPATISRAGDAQQSGDAPRIGEAPRLGDPANSGRPETVAPQFPSQVNTQSAANRWGDPWAENDPWKLSTQAPAGGSPQTTGITSSAPPAAANNNWPNQPAAAAPGTAGMNGVAAPPLAGQATALNPATASPNSGFAGDGQAAAHSAGVTVGVGGSPGQSAPTEQPPWMPLLVVSLSLVGSLSANLFLGWSYLDARQKYRTLVRKTANTFRRAAGVAAA